MSGGAGAVVLDASAVLALLHARPGAVGVAGALARALPGRPASLALARLRGLPVLTADRAWVRLDVGVEVRPIR